MILLFGANGAAGRAFIEQHGGHNLTAVLRAADDGFFAARNIPVTTADVLDEAAVDATFERSRPDTVISFVGGKNDAGIRSDATGNIHIIRAAERHTPNARFILITSMGCGEQWDGMSERFKQALGEAVQAKTEAENVLRQSSLNWSILRPCGLGNGESKAYRLSGSDTPVPAGYMTRNGLAAAVLAVLNDAGSSSQVYSVTADPAEAA